MVFSKKLLIIVFIGASLLPVRTYAVDWFPIVPCGLNQQPAGATRTDTLPDGKKVPHDYKQECNQCLLVELGKNVIDLTFYGIVPSLGTFFFLLAGFYILLGGKDGKPDMVNQGKKIMWDTAIGITIILCSWLITNFILRSIASDQLNKGKPWYTIECKVQNLKDATNATVPKPTTNPGGTGGGSGGGGTGQCKYSNANLCQAASMTCSTSSCGQYAASVNKYANKWSVDANLIKAVIMKESSCDATKFNTRGNSYGLMAFQPNTAILVSQYCGVSKSNASDSGWLTDPKNSDAIICMGAYYLRSIGPNGQCGSNIQNMAAGYNAGPGNCAPSVDCANETSCTDGGTKRKWECLYDNSAHTICNTRLNESKDYAQKILYCYNNPGF